MSSVPSRAPLAFSCIGHLCIHLFTAFYFVIVLELERAWRVPYPQLIELWMLGSVLVGAAALPAGLLADRFGANALMIVFFAGIGGASIVAGLTHSPTELAAALAGIGLFAAIYHPVGVPWLVRNSGPNPGKALGFNGIFGSLGTAVAGLSAGLLIDWGGWRVAFIVPGALALATAAALAFFVARGRIPDAGERAEGEGDEPSGAERRRVFAILGLTMFAAGIVYQSTQAALPKLLAERHGPSFGGTPSEIGMLISGIYAAAGVMQMIGGYLADRFPSKVVYVTAIAVQIPLLWLAASAAGSLLVATAAFMVMGNAAALPAENMLLARYAPARRHGLAFGLKFVLAFGAGPVAVQLVAAVTAWTGDFYWVFAALALVLCGSLAAASRLPGRAGPSLVGASR